MEKQRGKKQKPVFGLLDFSFVSLSPLADFFPVISTYRQLFFLIPLIINGSHAIIHIFQKEKSRLRNDVIFPKITPKSQEHTKNKDLFFVCLFSEVLNCDIHFRASRPLKNIYCRPQRQKAMVLYRNVVWRIFIHRIVIKHNSAI